MWFGENKIIKKLSLIFISLFIIISGLIATSSSMNPMSEYYRGWYDFKSGQVHCFDKLVCLHELVHEYDWESGEKQISETPKFKTAVANYYKSIMDKEEKTWLEEYIYTFPGVGGEYLDYGVGGWGGFGELYAEIFSASFLRGLDIPKEFEQFYDKKIILERWEKYPNFKSRW